MRTEDFERLYDEHAEPLLGFLVYRTGDRMLAGDLLADTFERVLRGRPSIRPAQGEREDLALRATGLAAAGAREAHRGGAGGDRVALRRRPHRPGDRKAKAREADDR
jgi:DNA-directed RNA polymerase specialized sigma24 family protein